ncbi:AAA family ATPase [Bacillus timonensis]|nr:AAA family ATPase [Bacillus timonensis]
MTPTKTYINQWKEALQIEINFLKKYGSTKYRVTNGRLLSSENTFNYYFDCSTPLKVPNGSSIKLEWGNSKHNGRILSSEGKGIILALEQSFGDLIHEANLLHDPWELLEHLIERLDGIKKSKQKRIRIKKLMDPSHLAKHPTDAIKSNVHELVLRSKYNPVTFVWGPPGTGKTYTLARVAANKYLKEKSVLILSHSNQAVDVLMKELIRFIRKIDRFREGDILRYGHMNRSEKDTHEEDLSTNSLIEKQDPKLILEKEQLIEERIQLKIDLIRSFSKRDSNQLLEIESKLSRLLDKMRQREMTLLEDAFVIGTTLAKAASDPAIFEREFDVVIVDEASMAYVPQVGFAASLGKNIIICGDFKQLPPIASARHKAVEEWLKEDIFHKSGVVKNISHHQLHPHLFLLREQRRMHPEISAFTNKHVYQSLVGDHPSVFTKRKKIVHHAPFINEASILIDTSHTGEHCINEKTSHSRMNIWNVLLSFQLIHEAYESGLNSIGYVTPYRAQALLMETLLGDIYRDECLKADIIAATVHRFQGSERDVMIFDSVDSYPQERVGMLLTGKNSERLINVAITRTKGKFIHLSDTAFVKEQVYKNKTIRQLVEHQMNNNKTVTTNEIGSWIRNQHPSVQWMHAKKLDRLFIDIASAKKTIVLSLPKETRLSSDWIRTLKSRSTTVKLTIISEYDFSVVNPTTSIRERNPFSFVAIDSHLIWLGVPFEANNRTLPPFVASRVDSEAFVQHVLTQLPIE